MIVNLYINDYNNVQVYWSNVTCSYTDLRLTITNVGGTSYYDRVYINSTAPSYTFFDLPAATYNVEVSAGSGTSDANFLGCDTGNGEITTMEVPNFCIPLNTSNISFSKLAQFYGLNPSNITLSGPNDPSTGNTIFGKSDLPTTGHPSKLRPNAVSELFNTCGGVFPYLIQIHYDYPASGRTDIFGGISHGNNMFVLAGYSGVIMTSTNIGVTWTNRTSGVGANLDFVYYVSAFGLFITGGASGTILTSPDGITWTSRSSGVGTYLYSCTFGNGLAVIVGASGRILTSPDGITWTLRTSGTTNHFYGVTFGNGVYMAVGNQGIIHKSTNGTSWSALTSGETTALTSVAFLNGRFIAVGLYGVITTSTDFDNWVRSDFVNNHNLAHITVGDKWIKVVGDYGINLISANGINWLYVYMETTATMDAVGYGEGYFVSVGHNGTIVRGNVEHS